MWYEILPSFGIIVVGIGLSPFVSFFANKLVLGNNFRRRLDEPEYRLHYRRDMRFTGSPYKLQGLEAIPDE